MAGKRKTSKKVEPVDSIEADILDVIEAQGGSATSGLIIAIKSYLYRDIDIDIAISSMIAAGKLQKVGDLLEIA